MLLVSNISLQLTQQVKVDTGYITEDYSRSCCEIAAIVWNQKNISYTHTDYHIPLIHYFYFKEISCMLYEYWLSSIGPPIELINLFG